MPARPLLTRVHREGAREHFGARIKSIHRQSRCRCARIRAASTSSRGDCRVDRGACADSVRDRISRRARPAARASLGAGLRDRSGRGARSRRRKRRFDAFAAGFVAILAAGSETSASRAKAASCARVDLPARAADRAGIDRSCRRSQCASRSRFEHCCSESSTVRRRSQPCRIRKWIGRAGRRSQRRRRFRRRCGRRHRRYHRRACGLRLRSCSALSRAFAPPRRAGNRNAARSNRGKRRGRAGRADREFGIPRPRRRRPRDGALQMALRSGAARRDRIRELGGRADPLRAHRSLELKEKTNRPQRHQDIKKKNLFFVSSWPSWCLGVFLAASANLVPEPFRTISGGPHSERGYDDNDLQDRGFDGGA